MNTIRKIGRTLFMEILKSKVAGEMVKGQLPNGKVAEMTSKGISISIGEESHHHGVCQEDIIEAVAMLKREQ